jgi:hypothetical protein
MRMISPNDAGKTRQDALSAIPTATHHRKKTKKSEANQAKREGWSCRRLRPLQLGYVD